MEPLQLLISDSELDTFRDILKKAARDYVLSWKEEAGCGLCTRFTIECKQRIASQAFWHLGILDERYRLSKRDKILNI